MAANSDVVLDFIKKFPGRDDDEIARTLGVSPRQQVNQICRSLERAGKINRTIGSSGKIVNHPSRAAPLIEPQSTIQPISIDSRQVEQDVSDDVLTLMELGEDRLALVRIVLRHSLFPDPQTVASFGGAVFPSVRDQKNRVSIGQMADGRQVLLDDNVTPRWALLWAHGVPATHHLPGWTFAHIWGASRDPDAYTNLANLCMMPEFFGSLSDKQGPLCAYLRYHSWDRYGWCHGEIEPSAPEGYDTLDWRYLPAIQDPVAFVGERVDVLKNQRVTLLRSLR